MKRSEAIEIIRKNWPDGRLSEALETLVPEFTKSEDEKMIRIIEDAICTNEAQQLVRTKYGLELTNLADWLEKQGKQDTDISSFSKEQQVFMRKYVSLDKITLIKLLTERDTANAEIIESFEKQSEQTPHNICDTCEDRYGCVNPCPVKLVGQKSTEKVESKFNVGEWVISEEAHHDYRICQIIGVDNIKYFIESIEGYKGFIYLDVLEKLYHFWTIQDAKDGDVLTCHTIVHGMTQTGIVKQYVGRKGGCSQNFKCYVFNDWDNDLHFDDYMGSGVITPATKEQRDKLEKTIADAGYTFDFDKKELKKIEQESVPITDEWSEEDEKIKDAFIKRILENYNGCSYINGISEDDVLDWFRTLKYRIHPSQWKPTDAQVESLELLSRGEGSRHIILRSLYNDLKKLRKE